MKINLFYFRNAQGVYYRPLWTYISFYMVASAIVAVILQQILKALSMPILHDLMSLDLLALVASTVALIVYIGLRSYRDKGFVRFIDMTGLESAITRALIDTRNINRVKDVSYLLVPWVVCTWRDDKIRIEIAKIPSLRQAEIDDLSELVDSCLIGKYSNFAINSKLISDDRLEFKFFAENIGENKTFVPRTLQDLIQKPYELVLQKDLKINLAKSPHLAVWGASGFGKTTVLLSLIAQMLSCGTDLRFIDGKNEFSSLAEFYPSSKIVSDQDEILQMLAVICKKLIPARQKIVAAEVNKQKKFGLRGYDIGLRPVVIVADEVGSVVGSMDNKQKKQFQSYLAQIAQKGRSISIFLIMASQSPATDVVPQSVRAQFSTKILLGSSNVEIQRMAFGVSVDVGNVEEFRGYYTSDGLTVSPQKFFVPNLYKNRLNELNIFEKLYKIGPEHIFETVK